jgi:hypothetical protein
LLPSARLSSFTIDFKRPGCPVIVTRPGWENRYG